MAIDIRQPRPCLRDHYQSPGIFGDRKQTHDFGEAVLGRIVGESRNGTKVRNDLDRSHRFGRCVSDEQESDQRSQSPDFRDAGFCRSGFKSISPSGTELRLFRRISDKDLCRHLSFWANRKIQRPSQTNEINRLHTIRGLAIPSARNTHALCLLGIEHHTR